MDCFAHGQPTFHSWLRSVSWTKANSRRPNTARHALPPPKVFHKTELSSARNCAWNNENKIFLVSHLRFGEILLIKTIYRFWCFVFGRTWLSSREGLMGPSQEWYSQVLLMVLPKWEIKSNTSQRDLWKVNEITCLRVGAHKNKMQKRLLHCYVYQSTVDNSQECGNNPRAWEQVRWRNCMFNISGVLKTMARQGRSSCLSGGFATLLVLLSSRLIEGPLSPTAPLLNLR